MILHNCMTRGNIVDSHITWCVSKHMFVNLKSLLKFFANKFTGLFAAKLARAPNKFVDYYKLCRRHNLVAYHRTMISWQIITQIS